MYCADEKDYMAKKAADERPALWPDEDFWGKLPQFPCLVCPCDRTQWIEGTEEIKAHLMGHFPQLWIKGKKEGKIAHFPQGLREAGILGKLPEYNTGEKALIDVCCWALLSPPPEKWRIKRHLGFYVRRQGRRGIRGDYLKRKKGMRRRSSWTREIQANNAFWRGMAVKERMMKRLEKRRKRLTKKRCWKLSVLPNMWEKKEKKKWKDRKKENQKNQEKPKEEDAKEEKKN